jgi:alginate O-acetyltransferase complex protein AlgI
MLFNSLEFLLLFMPVTLAVAMRLRRTALLSWITLASFVFYAFAGHVWFLVPMAITMLLDFWVGRRLPDAGGAKRKALLLLSLSGNLGLLAYFKYSALLVRTAREASLLFGIHGLPPQWESGLRVVLPAGISFYTFQTLSYVLDIYRGHAKPEKSFWAYTAFVAFFPHLVAGPLTRHSQLIPQLVEAAERRIRPQWWSAISLFSVGLCKKVLVADRIAQLSDPMIDHIRDAGMLGAWLAVLGYAMQIYFDFSGYSDMAIGLGRLFNVELPQNFDSPYKARNPSDFWRRWHITLSQWLRDYLYISLGGNRKGHTRTQINLMITMALGGLWHGANWTFMAWGVFHGLLLVVYHRAQKQWDAMPVVAQRALMFVLVLVGWVFFRAPSITSAGQWLARMAGAHGLGLHQANLAPLAAFGLACVIICNAFDNAYERDMGRLPRPAMAALGLATAAAIVMMNYSSKFLYFQF